MDCAHNENDIRPCYKFEKKPKPVPAKTEPIIQQGGERHTGQGARGFHNITYPISSWLNKVDLIY